MKCDHCLRGEAQNVNIKLSYIEELLKQVNQIFQLTITGGEPSLNVQAIKYIIWQLKFRKVELGSFYIATNGKKISADFVMACLELYSMCYEKEMCEVAVSNDIYHQVEGEYDTTLLDGLAFFRRKHEREGLEYPDGHLIAQGRTHHGREPFDTELEVEGNTIGEGNLYLNARGWILAGCDWSYKSQVPRKICRASDNVLEKVREKFGEEDE